MRLWLLLTWLALGCGPPPAPLYVPPPVEQLPATALAPTDPVVLGNLDDRMVDFAFDGGQLEFEMYRSNGRVVQVARSRYAVPVMLSWSMTALENLAPDRGQVRIPLRREGTAWEVAYGGLYLLSDEAAYVTGSSLVVDGGLSQAPRR